MDLFIPQHLWVDGLLSKLLGFYKIMLPSYWSYNTPALEKCFTWFICNVVAPWSVWYFNRFINWMYRALFLHIYFCLPWMNIIARVYRLSDAHCQMTRYSQRVPGYLTRYSASANEIFLDKNQPMRLCFTNQVRPGREWFSSPLGDFNRLFEGLIGELFQLWHWNMFYFFNDISLAP